MLYRLEIPGDLPTLNEYINAERIHRMKAAKLKADTQKYIRSFLIGAPHFEGHVFIYFTWIRSNKRCDKDNVEFAKKFILDALQESEVIEGDSWKLCTPFTRGYDFSKNDPKTIVIISTGRIETYEDHS